MPMRCLASACFGFWRKAFFHFFFLQEEAYKKQKNPCIEPYEPAWKNVSYFPDRVGPNAFYRIEFPFPP